jgi:hypothetical protein
LVDPVTVAVNAWVAKVAIEIVLGEIVTLTCANTSGAAAPISRSVMERCTIRERLFFICPPGDKN